MWCRHDYFLRRPKAGRLRPSVSHSLRLSPAARWAGVPKVAPELLPWPVGVLVVASMGWCSKSWGGVPKSFPESPRLDGVLFQKLGWCSKTLSQNPHSVYYSGEEVGGVGMIVYS